MGDSNGNGCISQKQRLQIRGIESAVIAGVVGLVLLVGNTIVRDLLDQWRDEPLQEQRIVRLEQNLGAVRSEMSELREALTTLTVQVTELNVRLQHEQEKHGDLWVPYGMSSKKSEDNGG